MIKEDQLEHPVTSKLGLVINFGEKVVKDGIHRVVNGL